MIAVPDSFLGIVCGLKMEARSLEGAGHAEKLRVGVSAAKPERAEAIARQMAREGAVGLVSFGLCGALDPDLRAGDLVVPDRIVANGDTWDVTPLPDGGTARNVETGLGSEDVIGNPDQKSSLFASSGAAIVDMESHRLAAVAAEMNLPFYVLRAVSDEAGQAIPVSALSAVNDQGGTRPLSVILGLMGRPGDLPALMGLKKGTDRAMETLKNAARTELPRILRSVELV